MKIAIVTDTFLPQINGVTKTLQRMIDYLDEKEITYRVFTADYMAEAEMDAIISFKGISFLLYPEYRIALPNYIFFKKQLDAYKPDVIHVLTPATMGFMGIKYGKERGIPMVASYTTDISAYLKYYKVPFLEIALWQYFKYFHDHCKFNLVPSVHSKTQLSEQGIKNTTLWGRGIELERFSVSFDDQGLRKEYAPENEHLLLYVGRVSVEKDLIVLLETVDYLNELKFPFKLLIVGDGPQLNALKALKTKNVYYLGYQKGEMLSKLYASCDIFVFPSKTETFGNVILEAMASKTAVVGVNAGGILENLEDGVTGLSFEADNSVDFAHKIIRMATDPILKNACITNAFERVRYKSWGSLFDRLMNLYRFAIRTKALEKKGEVV
jgi:glycosyltransferase involved in cell wall biosynthesis